MSTTKIVSKQAVQAGASLNGRGVGIIMSCRDIPRRPTHRQSQNRLARAFARNQLKRPKLMNALRILGQAKGYKVAGDELCLDLIGGIGGEPDEKGRIISATDIEMRLAANPHVRDIKVYLDSPGGLVVPAQRIYNALRNHGAFVEVEVQDMCASAANQILLAGDLRTAWPQSRLLLHATSVSPAPSKRLTAATHRYLAQHAEDTDRALVDLYVERTGKDRRRFEREFQNERDMSISTAISLGLIHAMVAEVEWKNGRPYYFPS